MTPARRLLAGLAGSPGPDISCARCFHMLDAYVEAELVAGAPPTSMEGMTGHLRNCPACHEEYESLRALVLGQP